MQDIQIMCKGSGTAALDELVPFQGTLKTLSGENYLRLKTEILEDGFSFPVFVWENKGKKYIIDGHQRVKTLSQMKDEGFNIPSVPVAEVKAPTYKDAKKKVLAAASVYGRIDMQGLYDFLSDADLTVEEIMRKIDLPLVDLDFFKETFFDDIERKDGDGENGKDNPYTHKIEVPIYVPTGEKPEIFQLAETDKTSELINKILEADIPEDDKNFLKLAAYRHTVFNYELIAEYYAHASKPVQELMEQSALVIIDFNKAIENGFVSMSTEIAEAFVNDEEITE